MVIDRVGSSEAMAESRPDSRLRKSRRLLR
jgi:hypothetical protein